MPMDSEIGRPVNIDRSCENNKLVGFINQRGDSLVNGSSIYITKSDIIAIKANNKDARCPSHPLEKPRSDIHE